MRLRPPIGQGSYGFSRKASAMTFHSPRTGTQAIGILQELDHFGRLCLRYLRAWTPRGDHQQAIVRDTCAAIGLPAATETLESLSQICDLLARHGRKPVMRHHPDCPCIGKEEACFAHLVLAATTGEREDALMMALLMVRPDFAPILVGLCQNFGLHLHRISLMQDRAAPAAERLH